MLISVTEVKEPWKLPLVTVVYEYGLLLSYSGRWGTDKMVKPKELNWVAGSSATSSHAGFVWALRKFPSARHGFF
jgi:hypothetical protein